MANLTNSGNLIDAINSKQNLIIQSTNQPSNPNTGDYRYDTTNKLLKYYNGSSWDAVGANVRVLTQNEYDQLTPAEKSNGTLYLITGDSDQLTIKWANITDKPNFSTVATSGSYNDLSDKPTIPSALGDLTGNSDNITEGTTNKFVTSAEKSKISTAVQPGDLATVATSGSYNDLSDTPTIPSSLGDLSGTSDNITEGSTNKFVTTAEKSKISTAVQPGDLATVATSGDYNDLINLPSIPVDADDVNALPDTTKYGASLSMTMNSSTYVVTAQLKDQDGNNLGTAQTIDLPLESVVVSGSYDSATKKVILTLKDGSTIDFSVADLISGLQSEITSTNKLDADLVDDTNSAHKFVSATEKSTWDGKQDALTTAQLNAANSGITSAKVSTYDGYATSKQDKLTAGTGISIDPTTNTISNTQTSAERGNITGTLSDQTDLNTALNAKANDADVVKLTGAQTIAGTKTFQDEPIVPSKTRPAIYHGQKIATEAQVYAKQDKLTIGDGLKMEGTTLSVIKEPVEYSGGAGITITKGGDYSAMRGPAPVGFHVPSIEDRQGLKSIMDGLTFSRQSGAAWMDVLKLAPAGLIDFDLYTSDHPGKAPEHQGYGLFYRSSTPVIGTTRANNIQLDAASINIPSASFRTYGYSIRCFKDSFVVPTSSWTVLNGTLGSAGVFWDSANGLISVTGNGTTGYTIMDKNLGANTVYNYGATCTESNCGKYYQRGNNFGFDYAGPEYTTQVVVDASSYGPGNYYSFDEFFFGDVDWTDPSNDNLRGGVTGTKDSISNSGVTSVNGQTGDVSISSAEWGNITGTLSNQTDLNTALASKVGSSNNTINNVIHLSQADYDALATKDANTWYSTPDGASGGFEPENAGSSGQVLTKTSTGYNWATISTGRSLSKTMVNNQKACVGPGTAIELSYETTRAGFLTLEWLETTSGGSSDQSFSVDGTSYFWGPTQPAGDEITRCVVSVNGTNYYPDMNIVHRVIMAVGAYSTVTAHLENFSIAPSGVRSYLKFCDFFYFE